MSAKEIAALRRWPKMLALAFIAGPDGKGTITFEEFCDAQDEYEEVLRRLMPICRPCSPRR